MKIETDFTKIHLVSEKAFREMAEILSGEFTKAITDPVWDWPTGGKRDIVDTGRLRRDQQQKVTNRNAYYTWPVEYATAVHNGAVLKNGALLPARRWTDLAITRKNPSTVFAALVGKVL